jgi:hypothetical protein
VAAVEEVELLARLAAVVLQRQAEAHRQVAQRRVGGVDQLGAPFGHLARKRAAQRSDTPADACAGFVDRRADALARERDRRLQAGEAGADDGHLRRIGRRQRARPGQAAQQAAGRDGAERLPAAAVRQRAGAGIGPVGQAADAFEAGKSPAAAGSRIHSVCSR